MALTPLQKWAEMERLGWLDLDPEFRKPYDAGRYTFDKFGSEVAEPMASAALAMWSEIIAPRVVMAYGLDLDIALQIYDLLGDEDYFHLWEMGTRAKRRSEAATKREQRKRERRAQIARNFARNGQEPTAALINSVIGGARYDLRCTVCGEWYKAARIDSGYCSNACRQAAYRARRAAGAHADPLPRRRSGVAHL